MAEVKADKHRLEFLILIIILLLLGYLGRYFALDSEGLKRFLEGFPVFYAGLIFVILYVFVTFFIWLSKDIFRFVAALLFGASLSTLFVWLAEIINAFILFHFSRRLGRSFVENSLKGKYKNLDEKLTRINFFWLFMFRTTPLVPFRFLDLAAGLTKITFKRYLAAVILGSPLRIFWVQYIVAAVGKKLFTQPTAVAEYLLGNKLLFALSFIYIILVILVASKLKPKK